MGGAVLLFGFGVFLCALSLLVRATSRVFAPPPSAYIEDEPPEPYVLPEEHRPRLINVIRAVNEVYGPEEGYSEFDRWQKIVENCDERLMYEQIESLSQPSKG